jgi:hypothetical protein
MVEGWVRTEAVYREVFTDKDDYMYIKIIINKGGKRIVKNVYVGWGREVSKVRKIYGHKDIEIYD